MVYYVMFIVFPGQGSQKTGMGQNFIDRSTFKKYVQIAEEITKVDVKYLLTQAPQEELDKTENAQISLFVFSYSLAIDFMQGKAVNLLAGHSLGQYVALAIANIISFEQTCELLLARSRIMSNFSGAMLAVLGVSFEEANVIANLATDVETKDCCFVANHNSSTQVVLSGTFSAIAKAKMIASEMFGKKAIQLATSGPFHSPYMEKACKQLQPTIEKLNFNEPTIPIISNIFATAEKVDWKFEISNHMQLPVRWCASIEYAKKYILTHQIADVFEIGVSPVLGNMAKRDGFEIKYFAD